jgi:hypothetical protein
MSSCHSAANCSPGMSVVPGYLPSHRRSHPDSSSHFSTSGRRYITSRPSLNGAGPPVPAYRQYHNVPSESRVIAATSATVTSSPSCCPTAPVVCGRGGLGGGRCTRRGSGDLHERVGTRDLPWRSVRRLVVPREGRCATLGWCWATRFAGSGPVTDLTKVNTGRLVLKDPQNAW